MEGKLLFNNKNAKEITEIASNNKYEWIEYWLKTLWLKNIII